MSRWATFLIVIFGIAIGFQVKSIAHIWGWLMMALGAGVIIPNVLRWYWWRLNGWGYSIGIFSGYTNLLPFSIDHSLFIDRFSGIILKFTWYDKIIKTE